jgi:hypothetical protein
LRYLLERRELWKRLGAAPETLPAAVEELLRFVSPVLWLARLPAEDIELDGQVLRKGTRVQLGIGAANHDPREFPNPEQLDFTRPKVNSLAFGYGPHFCLGAALARMETQVALSRLLDWIPQMQPGTRHFEYRPLYFLRALQSLPAISGSSRDRASGCKMRSPFLHARFSQFLDPEDLARVHYVVRIDSLLNRAHDAHRLAVLGKQKVDLAAADAMLAGTGAVES